MQPTKGQIYTSTLDPSFQLFIEEVTISDPDEGEETGIWIECCEARHQGDMSAIGMEMTGEEWAAMVDEHRLIAQP